jgi:cytosine/adenosine deaminase-related metal-dependent hydrolase
MATTSIRGRFVVGFDGNDHCLIPDGEVVYRGDTIVHVGPAYSGAVDRRIDVGNAIVGPGFIDLDALGDLDSTVLAFDNQPGWATGRIWSEAYARAGPREAYDPDELAFQRLYAFAHLVRNGITTAAPIASLLYREWAETYDEFSCAVDAAARVGLRVYLGPAYRTGVTVTDGSGRLDRIWDEPRGLEGLAEAIRFVRTFDGAHGGLIRGMLAPDRIETCTPRLLRETADAANALGCPVRLHCCQSHYEFETVSRLHQRTPIQWIRDNGFLGSRTFLPHGVFLAGHSRVRHAVEEDVDLLAASGASLVHCPLVMLRQGNTMESFARLTRRGINIALGTDTFPPDLLENMRAGIMTCRLVDGDAAACSAADFYRAATLGGARALGRSDLGRLAPGAKADITVFDLDMSHHGQLVDPIQTMILNGVRGGFTTAVINGRLVMEQGELPGIDFAALHRQAQAQYDRLMQCVAAWAPQDSGRTELFAPSFPILKTLSSGGTDGGRP